MRKLEVYKPCMVAQKMLKSNREVKIDGPTHALTLNSKALYMSTGSRRPACLRKSETRLHQ